MLVHHETLVQYFTDQHILKGLGNRQKNPFKHLVAVTSLVNHQFFPRCEEEQEERGVEEEVGAAEALVAAAPVWA